MKITQKHYILILFSLATIVTAVIAYVFIYKKTIAQAEYYLTATKEVESENSRKQYEQQLIDTFNSSKDDRAKIATYLIHEDKIVDFIELVEKVGVDSKTELALSAINSSEGKIKAMVNIKGKWENMMSALMLLENLPVSLLISNVRMNSSEDKTWNISLDIEVLTTK